jgi:dTMP kinase
MKHKGLLISIEGIDGSGKSSLAGSLEKTLKKNNLDVILTKEPGDTPLGKDLRKILHEEKAKTCDKAEYLLFGADRAQHFETLVIPALKDNKIVISDRLADSSVAYQGYGRGLDIEMIKSINQWAMEKIEPDIVFYIKIDLETALPRIVKRGETLTSFEIEKKHFWEKVSSGYDEIFKKRKNVVALDGTKSIEDLTKQAAAYVLEKVK